MKKPVPRFVRFDNRSPDKVPLYPFPLPQGVRAVATTNGTSVDIYDATSGSTGSSLKGFVPHIEQAIVDLYHALYSEPDPRYTQNGEQVVFPMHAFDIIIHDRDNGGSGDTTNRLLSEWAFDDEWPAPPEAVCAVILAHMPAENLSRGSDTVDLWQRRAHLKRGLIRIGMCNPYSNPRPILRYNPIAPDSWDSAFTEGCAGRNRDMFWRQVDNCFVNGYVGCLVIDVWQPWSVKGDAFQLINEEDLI